ncbi:MAG: methyltransferase domain-containing protein [Acidimicrobiales bacterium]
MTVSAGSGTADGWDPELYERFAAERSQPFFDLVTLCEPVAGGRGVDLGCGSGELTAELHRRLRLGRTTGIDNSPAMLAKAAGAARAGVTFDQADVAEFGTRHADESACDVVFSNAALHWVARDHRKVVSQWRRALRAGGQLAVQVPNNADHPSHLTATQVAGEEPFFSSLGGTPPPDPVRGVLRPEEYAQLLHDLGFADQHVRLQVYGHVLPSTAGVVDWVAGTSLTRFRSRLEPALYDAFVARYRTRLLDVLGDHQPYFYAFKRILFWARLP